MMKKNVMFVIMMGLFLAAFAIVVMQPFFGYENGGRSISSYYLENSLDHTGSANVVNSIVWDFRGFDTLGEETVLFTALVGVFTVVSLKKS